MKAKHPEPAPRPPLEDIPEHLRWIDSAGPQYRALKAEQRQWLADHGYDAMAYVRALMPQSGNGDR